MLQKGGFKWSKEAIEAFEKLKLAMNTTPVLALPDWNKVFVLETDASDLGIGAVLMQDQQPIGYLSKALGPIHQELSVYEKKLLALATAANNWRRYLEG